MTVRRPVVLVSGRFLELPSGDELTPVFLTVTLTDVDDASYYYYGGLDADGNWKINRYDKTNLATVTSAVEDTNGAYASLAAAWASRTILSYA